MQFNNQSSLAWEWFSFDSAQITDGIIQPGETVNIDFPDPLDEISTPGIRLETTSHSGNASCQISKTSTQIILTQAGTAKASVAGYGCTEAPANVDNAVCYLAEDLSVRILATYEGGSMPEQVAFHANLKLPRN
jgi:hypothetical protein